MHFYGLLIVFVPLFSSVCHCTPISQDESESVDFYDVVGITNRVKRATMQDNISKIKRTLDELKADLDKARLDNAISGRLDYIGDTLRTISNNLHDGDDKGAISDAMGNMYVLVASLASMTHNQLNDLRTETIAVSDTIKKKKGNSAELLESVNGISKQIQNLRNRRQLPANFAEKFSKLVDSAESVDDKMTRLHIFDTFNAFLESLKDKDSYYYSNSDFHFNKTLFDVLDSVFGFRNNTVGDGFTRVKQLGWFWDGIGSILASVIKPFVDAFGVMIKEVFEILLPVFNANISTLISLIVSLTETIVDAFIDIVTKLEPMLEKLVELLSKLVRVLAQVLYHLFIILEKEFYITEAVLVFVIINIFLINNNVVSVIVTVLIVVLFGVRRQFDSIFLNILEVPQMDRVVVGA